MTELTQKDFDLVKLLQEAGASKAKIRKITGRGVGTVLLICQSDSFEDYKINRIRKPKTYANRSMAIIQEIANLLEELKIEALKELL